MNVLMLLSNPFKPDPRVYKEAKALINHGKKVTILAWDRECRFPENEVIEGIQVYRLRIRSTYGDPVDFIIGVLRFYLRSIFFIRKMERFDVVHAHDFDTLPLGTLISRLYDVPLIYDMHDDYASMITESIPVFFSRIIDRIQGLLLKYPLKIIYASEAFAEITGRKGEIVLNCKDPDEYRFKKERGRPLKIVYIGIFRQKEFLTSLINAVKEIKEYSLLLGGDGPLKDYILKLIEKEKRIRYIGWVDIKDIPKYTAGADVIVIMNDPKKRYDRRCVPVKLCEAMAAGVPVIASEETEAGKIVKECNCGLLIPFGDVEALKNALIKLSEDSLREKFGKNGLRAAMKKYNEDEQMKNLLNVYNSI